jgi:hypothetical protein
MYILVIASQRVGAKRRPMTGSVKQSILSLRGEMDCFASLAMTAENVLRLRLFDLFTQHFKF